MIDKHKMHKILVYHRKIFMKFTKRSRNINPEFNQVECAQKQNELNFRISRMNSCSMKCT